VDEYRDLASEIKRLWKVEAIVTGALRAIPRDLEKNPRRLGIKLELIPKVVFVRTAQILRKVGLLEHG